MTVRHRTIVKFTGTHLVIKIPVTMVFALAAPEPQAAPILFTAYQQELFEMLMAGARMKDIAKRFNLSVNGAKHAVARVYRKCGVQGIGAREQLVRKYREAA